MKQIKFYMSIVAVSALLFTSCSKDDPGTEPAPGEKEMVALSFNGALQQFSKAMATKQAEVPIPGCKEDQVPASVTVSIQGPDGWIADATPEGADDYEIEIPVIPTSVDSDGDGAQNYLTFEAEELELPAGPYSLEYFAVYNGSGEQIWLAPRGDEEYGPANFDNFVENPLPIAIDLVVGTKHYVEVEVLCYDEHFARQYGYLFFDFEEVPLTYLCVFANICDETGRHFPGNIHVKVWDYDGAVPGVYNEDNLLVDVTNEVVRNDDETVYSAEPVCFPLPDPEGINLYHIEVWSVDGPGTPGETLIYSNELTDEEVKSFLQDPSDENPEGLENYLHIRYGEFCTPPLDEPFPCDVQMSCIQDDFESGEFSAYTGTQYHEFDPSDPYGGYLITDNASDYYPEFDNTAYDGNMLVLDGAPEEGLKAYFTLDFEICPGDYAFAIMDLKDLSYPDNGAKTNLVIEYISGGTTYVVDEFKIVDLVDNDTGIAGWKTIGFWMKADSDGKIKVEVKDAETANSGNDFAIDNVQICNYNICVDGSVNFLNGDELAL